MNRAQLQIMRLNAADECLMHHWTYIETDEHGWPEWYDNHGYRQATYEKDLIRFWYYTHFARGAPLKQIEEVPYPYCVCICKICGSIGKTIYSEIHWKPRDYVPDKGYYCKKCYVKIRRLYKRTLDVQKTETELNRVRKALSNAKGTNHQNNGPTKGIPNRSVS